MSNVGYDTQTVLWKYLFVHLDTQQLCRSLGFDTHNSNGLQRLFAQQVKETHQDSLFL